ncbi:glucosaminidase domain-containing protein [Veillonella caviae]|uniref:glucosaminidase domain-containing protein n=1 Tax=Veillonella caviae TaxID=248316 RepID=UPI001F49AC2C|nr:glucosaminidase domain-containing protein [Veillonella caviae]
MNPYFYELAKISANKAAENGIIVDPKWIYAQWHVETGGFTSNLQATHHNLGGIYSSSGSWMYFNDFPEFADYFGRYLTYYSEDGMAHTSSLYDYVAALHTGGYFSADISTYYNALLSIVNTIPF